MDKFDKKLFEKYFFYGLENREVLLEGIIFYTNHDLNIKYLNISSDAEQPSIKEKFRNLIEKTSRNWEQIYKFADLVKQPGNSNTEISQEEKERIRQKVFDKVKQLDEQGVFQKFKRGIFCTREFEYIYAYQNYMTSQEPPHKWTQEVYKTILQLNYLEENEPIEYYDKFLQAKLSRAKNTERYSKEELKKLQEIYEHFQERKVEENVKEM